MAGSANRERLSMGRNMVARGSAGIPLALGAMTGLIFHLISHTHWDREWYLPRAALQARLVAVAGDLLARLPAQPGYRSFLLDGPAVRGLGGETGQERDLYRWRGLDDKEVLLWHLPRAGYEIGATLPADAERLFAAWAPVRGVLVQRATGKHVPVFIGADHHGAHPDVP